MYAIICIIVIFNNAIFANTCNLMYAESRSSLHMNMHMDYM